MEVNLVLQVPTESLAVRAVVASVGAVVGARLLLRSGLRLPRVRVVAALLPALALAAIVAVGWTSAQLPLVMAPTDSGGLPIRVGGDYLNVAPLAVPVLLGLWAVTVAARIGLRLRRQVHTGREAAAALEHSQDCSRVRGALEDLAARMNVSTPRVAVAEDCPGGATVVGIRDPIVVLDDELLSRLDDLELEGVLAHELAHVRRRDNLVTVVLGVVRDLAFFVPGGTWALRQLHAERELAADQTATSVTDRPAALASGLLKVLEAGEPQAAAALRPRGTLVGRVEQLLQEPGTSRWWRSGLEVLLVAVVGIIAVVGAVQVPALVRDGGAREGLILLWHAENDSSGTAAADPGRVFNVYRQTSLGSSPQDQPGAWLDDDPEEMRPAVLRACEAGAACPDQETTSGLGLRPRPPASPPSPRLIAQWDATPVVANDEGLSIYLLSSVTP